MTFFGFNSFGKDKRKVPKQPRHPANGYGYHNGASTITLHRPPPPPVNLSSPSQVILGYPPWPSHPLLNPGAYSQPQQPTMPLPPRQPQHPPVSHQSAPLPTHNVHWASSATLIPPVHTSSDGRPRKKKSSLQLPASVIGQMNAASTSVTNLSNIWNGTVEALLDDGSSLQDRLSLKLDNLITRMDEENFSGSQSELELRSSSVQSPGLRRSKEDLDATSTRINHFAKVWQYSNSRLPPYLPPINLSLDTWPLLNLAARSSLSVYNKAKGSEKNDRVKVSVANGTKSVDLKSMPIDNMNLIVFAIRGTATFLDWSVNIRNAPTSPIGFLDNADNYCHDGFLDSAKAMIRPVSQRLRTLLQEDPSRGTASLLITGHSAGGAIAQLLYAHMTSETVQSELIDLMGFFKRVHCVTFGSPPVSLFPLQHPEGRKHRKNLFFAFANEGDPVIRADKAIVKSLLRLYTVPAPEEPCKVICPIVNAVAPGFVPPRIKKKKSMHQLKANSWPANGGTQYPAWKVPSSTLSLGGRVILMREKYGSKGPEDLEICSVTDEMLREVIYGDPMTHTMTLYAKRIELLATTAATGKAFG